MLGLDELMKRAELCFRRGSVKMSRNYMQELDRRTAYDSMPFDIAKRFNFLCDALWEKYNVRWDSNEEVDIPLSSEGHRTCTKCGGSKTYRYASGAIGRCYDCQGKGYQTEADIERVRRYYARIRSDSAARKDAFRDTSSLF